jgi:hypothetical protein
VKNSLVSVLVLTFLACAAPSSVTSTASPTAMESNPTPVKVHPSGPVQSLRPYLLIQFDQPVERASVLKGISLAGGGELIPLRLATSHEMTRQPRIEQDATHLMAYPTKALTPANEYTIRLETSKGLSPKAIGGFTVQSMPKEPLEMVEHYGFLRVGSGRPFLEDGAINKDQHRSPPGGPSWRALNSFSPERSSRSCSLRP